MYVCIFQGNFIVNYIHFFLLIEILPKKVILEEAYKEK